MNRRCFIGTALAATSLPSLVSANIGAVFSRKEVNLVGALATTILPEGDHPKTGADPVEVIRLLEKFFDETPTSRDRFRRGLRILERKLASGFPAARPADQNARLQLLLKNRLAPDPAFAFDVIRRMALIELFTRQGGRELLATPFRTAP